MHSDCLTFEPHSLFFIEVKHRKTFIAGKRKEKGTTASRGKGTGLSLMAGGGVAAGQEGEQGVVRLTRLDPLPHAMNFNDLQRLTCMVMADFSMRGAAEIDQREVNLSRG